MQELLEMKVSRATSNEAAINFPAPVAAPSFADFQAFTPAARTFTLEKPATRPGSDKVAQGGRKTSHFWVFASLAGDLAAAVIAALAAYFLRFHTSLHNHGVVSDLTLRQYAGYICFGSLSVVATLAWQGIYHRSVLLRPRWIKARIAKGVSLWTLGFLLVTLTLEFYPPISRVYTFLVGGCTLITVLAWRSTLETFFLHRPATLDSLRQRTILVGWNEEAARLCENFSRDPLSAYNVIGWVRTGADNTATLPTVPCLGDAYDMEQVLARHNTDMIIAADLNGPREQLMEVANICERELISFKMIPSCFPIFVSGLHLETMAGTPMIGVDRLPLDNSFNVALKRIIDIVGATIGLILFTPVMAVFAALVYIESPGAVIYRQRRCGLGGRVFSILKIRSMKLNAEANGKVGWSTKDDPRRLRFGAFMRKWNIDELPQFWNVIKGEMSLVGPRPERPELIRDFKHNIPHYNARHHAKPGITGWAQINGLRGDTDLSERIKCDLWYLENWNPILDFQIMGLTFFKRDGAC